jgi:hypothetical protein
MSFTAISTARSSEPTVNRLIGGALSRSGTFPDSALNGQIDAFVGDLLDLKQDLVTAGWRIFGSGDGAALYELSGVTGGAGGGAGGAFDVITVHTTGAGGFNQVFNTGATWFILQTPSDADVQRSLCFMLHSDSGLGEYSSFATDWSGGGAQPRPTASDEVCIYGNPTSTAADNAGRNSAPSGSNNRSYWVIGDKAEEYSFAYWNARTGTTIDDVHGCFIFGQVVRPNQGTNPPTTEDTDPHFFFFGGAGSSGSSIDSFAKTTWGNSDLGSIDGRFEDSSTIRERGLFAFTLDNETSPSAAAGGFYQMGIMIPTEHDNQNIRNVGDALEPFRSPGIVASNMIAKLVEVPQIIKGWTRPDSGSGPVVEDVIFFGTSTKSPSSPRIIEIGTNRHVNWNGLIFPWHPTEPVIAG